MCLAGFLGNVYKTMYKIFKMNLCSLINADFKHCVSNVYKFCVSVGSAPSAVHSRWFRAWRCGCFQEIHKSPPTLSFVEAMKSQQQEQLTNCKIIKPSQIFYVYFVQKRISNRSECTFKKIIDTSCFLSPRPCFAGEYLVL